jgi:hypothetical protein
MIELHEASHATIARALEIEVVHVVTDPADPHVRTRHRPGGTVGERIALLEKLAMVDLAGAVIEPDDVASGADQANAKRRCEEVVRLQRGVAPR